MKVITEAEVTNKKVLVRGDLDVPIKKVEGKSKKVEVVNDFRLKAMLPTLKFLLENKAKIILIGNLDRPKGKVVEKLRIEPVAKKITELLRESKKEWQNLYYHVVLHNNKNGFEFTKDNTIYFLENLRFDPREEENDESFAQELASLATLYVNECFASSHRKHTSFVSVPKYLPSFAGIQLAKEVKILSEVLKNPARPLLFIIGGAKTETKAPLVKKFAQIADAVLLGGLLMFEQKLEKIANVYFPQDSVRVDDIGPKSIEEFCNFIKNAGTIVWNGPMGKFEKKEFEKGTKAVAEAIAKSSAKSIVGGGDTVAALNKFGLRDKINFVSTGGGAMLEFLAKGTLPGLKALEK